jgi:hypothetical protein
MSYVPYESLAREEAKHILDKNNVPTVLKAMSLSQIVAVEELLSDAYIKGLETGFVLSEFIENDPTNTVESYVQGLCDGRLQGGEESDR